MPTIAALLRISRRHASRQRLVGLRMANWRCSSAVCSAWGKVVCAILTSPHFDARIEKAIDDIDSEISRCYQKSVNQGERENNCIIAPIDRFNKQAPDAVD